MPGALLYFTGTMELIGGVLIVIGLFTRPVAFILSGFMAVGLFHGAFPDGLLPGAQLRLKPALLYCFIFLYLAAAGPGPWALRKD